MNRLHEYDRIVIDRYSFKGLHGCESWCALEILPLADGHAAVIATELRDNPGTSITNMCQYLASWVCRDFGIAPRDLVWIEHYSYPSVCEAGNPRPFDLASFDLVSSGRDQIFTNSRWRRLDRTRSAPAPTR